MWALELNEYIKKYDTKELGAFGFNVLCTKKYTKKAYSEYLSGNKPQGWLGTFPLSDKRSLWQKAFIFDLVKYYIKKMLFNNTAFMVHNYRRWFSEETFKQFKFLSNITFGIDNDMGFSLSLISVIPQITWSLNFFFLLLLRILIIDSYFSLYKGIQRFLLN